MLLWHVTPNFYSLNWRVLANDRINNSNQSRLFSVESILHVCFFTLLLFFFQFLGTFNCWFTMPQECSVFDSRGNYDGILYSPTVSALLLKYHKDQRRWIDAMPNIREYLQKLKEIHICHHHFDCDWIIINDNHCRNRVSITKLRQKSQQSNSRH